MEVDEDKVRMRVVLKWLGEAWWTSRDPPVENVRAMDLSLCQTATEAIAAHIFVSDADAYQFATWAAVLEKLPDFADDKQRREFPLICDKISQEARYADQWRKEIQRNDCFFVVSLRSGWKKRPKPRFTFSMMKGYVSEVEGSMCTFKRSINSVNGIKVRCLRILPNSKFNDRLYKLKNISEQ